MITFQPSFPTEQTRLNSLSSPFSYFPISLRRNSTVKYVNPEPLKWLATSRFFQVYSF